MQRVSPEKKIPAQAVSEKKNSCKLKIPLPPITFLMVRPLQPLKANENVRLRQGSTWVPAVVSESANTPRSYIVTTTNGQDYRRNRRDLLQTGELPHIIPGPSQPFEPETEETPPDPSEMLANIVGIFYLNLGIL